MEEELFLFRVLLVDDEPAVIRSEKRTILNQTTDFEIVGAAFSVKKAIELFRQRKPHVVLTDIKMPGEDGISLIKYISQAKKDFETICVVVSGYSDFDYVHDSFIHDAYDYLLKPVVPREMEELFIRIHRELISREHTRLPAGDNFQEEMAKIDGSKALVEKITCYVENNLDGDNSIPAICRKFNISQPYLSRIFRKVKSCTFNEFVIQMKIQETKNLLHFRRELRINDIASMLGFSDQFYFSKVFKGMEGCTPSEYRNKWDIMV